MLSVLNSTASAQIIGLGDCKYAEREDTSILLCLLHLDKLQSVAACIVMYLKVSPLLEHFSK